MSDNTSLVKTEIKKRTSELKLVEESVEIDLKSQGGYDEHLDFFMAEIASVVRLPDSDFKRPGTLHAIQVLHQELDTSIEDA